jgi:glutaredoxin-dependent peroxiredoxin
LLSDFNKQISKKYGTIYKEFAFGMSGVSKRSAFVLDAEGIVRYAEVLDNAGNVPNFKAINETLAGL